MLRQRVVQEEVLAGEALAGHHMRFGAKVHEVEAVLGLRGPGGIPGQLVQLQRIPEAVGPVQAVRPRHHLLQGHALRGNGHGHGHRPVQNTLGR